MTQFTKHARLSTVALLALISATSVAQALECESESLDNVVCISIPNDAPEKFPTQAKVTSTQQVPRMISTRETSGAVSDRVLTETLVAESSEVLTSEGPLPEALLAGSRVENQLRYVEQFLKTGPASTGDLTVITSGLQQDQNKELR